MHAKVQLIPSIRSRVMTGPKFGFIHTYIHAYIHTYILFKTYYSDSGTSKTSKFVKIFDSKIFTVTKLSLCSLLIIRQRKRHCKIGKFWISNISKSNRTILMNIHIHMYHKHIYITNKIVYKPAADSSSRSREITIKKKVIKILTSNISEIYGLIILTKELDHELSKIYHHKEFWRD